MPQFANRTEGLRFRIVLKPGVAIGPGKADLLEAIDETASLTAAARRFRHELQAQLDAGAGTERRLRRRPWSRPKRAAPAAAAAPS